MAHLLLNSGRKRLFFAFLNAGVVIDPSALNKLLVKPVTLGIMIGLLSGKPLGILAGLWLGIRLGFAIRPDDLGRSNLPDVGLLSGGGFALSTFIAHLAFALSSTHWNLQNSPLSSFR